MNGQSSIENKGLFALFVSYDDGELNRWIEPSLEDAKELGQLILDNHPLAKKAWIDAPDGSPVLWKQEFQGQTLFGDYPPSASEARHVLVELQELIRDDRLSLGEIEEP
jgi:hypothetical protein